MAPRPHKAGQTGGFVGERGGTLEIFLDSLLSPLDHKDDGGSLGTNATNYVVKDIIGQLFQIEPHHHKQHIVF
jgi:hypothetical protein